jgi:LysR family transcriptional regulator (chromosome initiation inhibitor)
MELSAEHLRTIAAVVDHGTFERAAAALHITPSAVSQRMKALEQRAGRVLVQRTKPIVATSAGHALLRLARQLALLESEASALLDGHDASGRASVSLVVNADSLATWALPALASVDGVSFDIALDDQEHTLDRLRDGTAMAAITSDAEAVQGCTVAPLGSMRYRAVASPAFVARHAAEGWTPTAMKTAPMLVFDRKDALQDRYLHTRAPGAHPPRHYVPASTEFVRAAALGLGWGMLPDLQSAPLLEDGSLVLLDPDHVLDVPLYWQQWSLRSSTLAVVADALRDAAHRSLR